MKPFLPRLRAGEVLLADGAWGSLLMEGGLPAGDAPETINLSRPSTLEDIARLYLEAGAEIVETNTFGGSSLRLARHGLDGHVREVNLAGVEAVRRAVGERAYVAGSCGPTGRILKPYGDAEPDEVYESFREQIGVLVEAGVDLLCIETMTDLREAILAVRAARSITHAVPVLATMTFETTPRGFVTIMGATVEAASGELAAYGADVVGSNCGNGIDVQIGIAREFREHTVRPILIQANAGLPEIQDERIVYPETPKFMARKTGELLAAGVSIIGGCCGTTPEHIRAMRRAIDEGRAG